jgi:hypothetical protein
MTDCVHHYIHDESIPIVCHRETVKWYGFSRKECTKEIDRGYRTYRCCKCGAVKEFPLEIYDHETKAGKNAVFQKREKPVMAQVYAELR